MVKPIYETPVGATDVVYIGNKPVKRDTLTRTGVVWNGFGDVKTVDSRAASVLLRHDKVWTTPEQFEAIKKNLEDELSAAGDTGATEEGAQDDNGDTSGEPQPTAPATDDERVGAIKAALLALDSENTDHFTDRGKPKVEAVRGFLPEGVTTSTKEVNELFSELGGE